MAKKAKKGPEKGAAGVRTRIVGEGMVDPASLKANPDNWRKHGPEQREAMRELMETIGWVQRVIVNKRTGRLVDGHMRVEEAIAVGAAKIPVVYIDVSEREERQIIATLDPMSLLAGMDEKKLASILGEITPGSVGLQALIAKLEAQVGVDGAGKVKDEDVPLLDQSVQLSPGKEYVIVMADTEEDFVELRKALGLRMVRRGGYKRGSPFDDVGVERVITAKRFQSVIAAAKKRTNKKRLAAAIGDAPGIEISRVGGSK